MNNCAVCTDCQKSEQEIKKLRKNIEQLEVSNDWLTKQLFNMKERYNNVTCLQTYDYVERVNAKVNKISKILSDAGYKV